MRTVHKNQFIALACSMNRTGILPYDIVDKIGFYMRDTIRVSFQCYDLFSKLTEDYLHSGESPITMETKMTRGITNIIATFGAPYTVDELKSWMIDMDENNEELHRRGGLDDWNSKQYKRNYKRMTDTLTITEI
jgi:hypothetical protein